MRRAMTSSGSCVRGASGVPASPRTPFKTAPRPVSFVIEEVSQGHSTTIEAFEKASQARRRA
jgi:hypothetical protein